MDAPRVKRQKVWHRRDNEEYEVKFPEIVIFIVSSRIQRVRFDHLKRLARKKGFRISTELSEAVTHVVTEVESRDHVISILQRIVRNRRNAEFDVIAFAEKTELLSMDWFTACMEAEKPVEVNDGHRLPSRGQVNPDAAEENAEDAPRNGKFSCQRITPLNHPNKKFSDALEILEKSAEFRMGERSGSRALAFRKASSAIKALPTEIKSPKDIENLYDLKGGTHCKQVVTDILENDSCAEVEGIKNSDWFKTIGLFTGVFGCGIATAGRWYQMGLRTLTDVKRSYALNLTRSQLKGIEYYDELNAPVTREEANRIHQLVSEEVAKIRPGSTVVITGGFLRGKDTGHDVDLLISHPEDGQEEGILAALLQVLAKKSLIDYTDIQNSSVKKSTVEKGMDAKRNTMDHYERCFSIFRLPKLPEASSSASSDAVPATNGKEEDTTNGDVKEERSWVAKRVDFVIAPANQYAFALLGWTGSRMFNRSMRDYANKVMNMNLSSHGLFDKTKNCSLTAKTEQEIFDHLQLEYRKPEDRNC